MCVYFTFTVKMTLGGLTAKVTDQISPTVMKTRKLLVSQTL